MSFVFDKDVTPPNIPVKFEGGEFELMHRWMKASARTRVTEAIAAGVASAGIGQMAESDTMGLGLATAQRILAEHIITWQGVVDASNNPVPFHVKDPETGEKQSQLDEVMGRVPFEAQLEAMLAQMAMNGIRISDQWVDIVSRLLNDLETAERIAGRARDFFRSPAGKVGTSSTTYAAPETST